MVDSQLRIHEQENRSFRARIISFLREALIPWSPNPGWNSSGTLVVVGFLVWAVVVIGNAYGKASIPSEVTEIGKAAFYTGLGRATKKLDK